MADSDYVETIGAYGSSIGSTSKPDTEALADAQIDIALPRTGTEVDFGDWFKDSYPFDRNGTAATAKIEFTATSFPITNDQTIKITDAFGTQITYTVKSSQGLNDQQFAGVTGNSNIATSLAACINDANATDRAAAGCHGGTITASASGSIVTLTQDVEGTDGNTKIDISGFSQDVVKVSGLNGEMNGINEAAYKGFSGGTGVAATATITVLGTITADKTITIISEDGTDAAAGLGTTKVYTAKDAEDLTADPIEFDRDTGGVSGIATSIHECILDAGTGHNGKIVVSQNAGVLTLKQKKAGALGNTAVTHAIGGGEATITSFTGGEYALTGPGAILPGSSNMTFTDHATNNHAIIHTAIKSVWKAFTKIKK
jgi:hypothetical protein